jgi:hypothetical protein
MNRFSGEVRIRDVADNFGRVLAKGAEFSPNLDAESSCLAGLIKGFGSRKPCYEDLHPLN